MAPASLAHTFQEAGLQSPDQLQTAVTLSPSGWRGSSRETQAETGGSQIRDFLLEVSPSSDGCVCCVCTRVYLSRRLGQATAAGAVLCNGLSVWAVSSEWPSWMEWRAGGGAAGGVWNRWREGVCARAQLGTLEAR